VPRGRSGPTTEDKILALTSSNLSVQHACRRCTKCAIATSLMMVISKPMERSTS
jgi:hypothetical protein